MARDRQTEVELLREEQMLSDSSIDAPGRISTSKHFARSARIASG